MNLLKQMQAYFPGEVVSLLRQIGEVAQANALNVYLIGGSIRDMLLPHRDFDWDIDLVVEYHGSERLAHALQKKLGGNVQVFEEFGTAKLNLSETLQFDFAIARTESYTHPGAPPKVRFSNLSEDLSRRDFSINAMALYLDPERFGDLIDVYNGYQDLHNKTLRTLGDLKFIEDPVRSWRAVRLSLALDFEIEPQTETLIQEAMHSGHFDTFLSARVLSELKKILRKPQPEQYLKRLDALSVSRCLSPSFQWNAQGNALFEQLRKSASLFGEESVHWDIYLLALLLLQDANTQHSVLAESHLSRRSLKIWADIQSIKRLSQENLQNPVTLFKALSPLHTQALWIYSAYATEARSALFYFENNLKHIQPLLNGRDILEHISPGPQIKQALSYLLEARLEGRVKTRKEEETLLLEWIKHHAKS